MSNSALPDLSELRDQIDSLDQQILQLINQRARCAEQVAKVKRGQGETEVQFFRPEREAQVLQRIKELNPGPLADEEAARLFREIMSACLALEQPMQIAFLGPSGTFTEEAAFKHFGHSVSVLPAASIADVFDEVVNGQAHYGVVPVENSTEGVVSHTLDQFLLSDLQVCGEVEVRIHHHLASRVDELENVERVYSHQQSLGQCRLWLDNHLSGIERIPVSSNAEAARRAAEENQAAAICGLQAVQRFGLQALATNIEDRADNTTRFLVIGKQSVAPSGRDKTSMLLSVHNRPGALMQLLKPLADNGISMNKIESRPSQSQRWDYVFFIDIDGHQEDELVAQALSQLQKNAALCRVLGSYPKAVL